MGDRCYCTLQVKELPEELWPIIEKYLGPPEEDDGLRLGFHEVNWATLPLEIERFLMDREIPFVWENDAGSNYGQGVVLFDGSERTEWCRYDDNLVLTISEARDPDRLEEATRWQKFYVERWSWK